MSETAASELVDNEAMSPDDFHDCIPRIKEVADEHLAIPDDLSARLQEQAHGLLLTPTLLAECAAALISGNVVLQGPPGTGKSSLARALATAFNASLLPVTAHEDWSTFEVIGRQELRVDESGNEEIVPVNGHFTEAVIRCAGDIPKNQDNPANKQATWLLIDELNRAHPDKAFGELFSVLGADKPVDITLAYQAPGNNRLVVPRRFRIIATVNSIDKQFVNSLSQGLRRRFTFLTMDMPARRHHGEAWGKTGPGASMASREFNVVDSKAIKRAAARTGENLEALKSLLHSDAVRAMVTALFELAEKVRYAHEDDPEPYIPIGTAPLIDTIELFLVRSSQGGLDSSLAAAALDWAISVKLVPLFDSGMVNREKLASLAESLPVPMNGATRRAMLEIASDGLHYVE